MEEMIVKCEVTPDDPRKRHFAPALPTKQIALRLADVDFQQ
jgi:hypothetical protein